MLKKIILIFITLLAISVFASGTHPLTIRNLYGNHWFVLKECSEYDFILDNISRYREEHSHYFQSELPNPVTCNLHGNFIKVNFIKGYAVGDNTGEYYPVDKLPNNKQPSYITELVAFFVNNKQITHYIPILDMQGDLWFRYLYDKQRQQYYIHISGRDINSVKTGYVTPYVKNHPKLKHIRYFHGYSTVKDHPAPAIILDERPSPYGGGNSNREEDHVTLYRITIYENIVQPDGTVSP